MTEPKIKAKPEAPAPKIRATVETPTVEARVTKKGGGKISTGEHVPGEGDIFHVQGDIIQVPADAVEELEERGWIEA